MYICTNVYLFYEGTEKIVLKPNIENEAHFARLQEQPNFSLLSQLSTPVRKINYGQR
jgi:hypothetical protein